MLLSRAFASPGACYGVAAGGVRSVEHVPERFRSLNGYDHTGDSCIIDPRGEVVAGPATGETILLAAGSLESVYAAKAACDVGGHYSRHDLFRLYVDSRPLSHIQIQEDTDQDPRTPPGAPTPAAPAPSAAADRELPPDSAHPSR